MFNRIFSQTHVIFCEYWVFHEFRRNLYITLAKYLEQDGIADLFLKFLTVFSSTDAISRYESSRLLYDISDMFFVAPCLAGLSNISFQLRPQWEGTQQNSIPTALDIIQHIKYFISLIISLLILQSSFAMHIELILNQHISTTTKLQFNVTYVI